MKFANLFLDLGPYLEGGRRGSCPSDIYDVLQNSEQKKLANCVQIMACMLESRIIRNSSQ